MSDLLTEVDDLMRQERFAKIWKDYGSLILAFIVGCIVFTGAFSAYKSWNKSVREEQTARVIALQSSGDYPQNILDADLSDLRAGLRGIAYLSAADAFLKRDKRADSLALYERVADDSALPVALSHMAALTIVRLSLDGVGAEAGPLLARVERVFSSSNSPWVYHARLEAALLEAHLNADYVAARGHLNVILNAPDLPKSLHEKARALEHVYGLRLKAALKTKGKS